MPGARRRDEPPIADDFVAAECASGQSASSSTCPERGSRLAHDAVFVRARPFTVFAAALATTLASAAPAAAGNGPKLALDGEAAIALEPDRVGSGAGGALRFGYELDAAILSITPEIGGSFHALGGDLAPSLYRGFGGARLALGAIVRPGLYGHIGYAHVSYGDFSRDAPTYDGGLFLDFTVLPVIDIGVHGGYAMIASSDEGAAIRWLSAGAHLAVVF